MKTKPSSPEAAAAAALTGLLTTHPELGVIAWTVGQRSGVLHGHHTGAGETGGIIDVCARVMGGTVTRSTIARGRDVQCIAQLVTVFGGVPVDVWSSYPLPENLASAHLLRLLAGRRIGTLVAGGAR